MFSEASGHIVVLCVAAGKCSFLVGVFEISTGFIQISLETITRNTAGFCFSVLNSYFKIVAVSSFNSFVHLKYLSCRNSHN